jgi:hypothetical protein
MSGGVTNASIRDALAGLLGKPTAGSRALCVLRSGVTLWALQSRPGASSSVSSRRRCEGPVLDSYHGPAPAFPAWVLEPRELQRAAELVARRRVARSRIAGAHGGIADQDRVQVAFSGLGSRVGVRVDADDRR